MPINVVVEPSASVCCWKAKSPVTTTVATVIAMPVRLTRTNRPGGRSSVINVGEPPVGSTVNVSATAEVKVLICNSATVGGDAGSVTPGMFSNTVPVNWPAAPDGVMRNPPVSPVIETKLVVPSPRCSVTPLMATLTTSPSAVVVCSIEKAPASVWPNTSIEPLPSTRTYWPAVRFSVPNEPKLSDTARPVALT
jgi:hypothetical protein